uniref:Transposase n=2 Tax=Caenorhabditis tropicalis TaxID=1561998 RepID=A0A1I7UZY3_9PELO
MAQPVMFNIPEEQLENDYYAGLLQELANLQQADQMARMALESYHNQQRYNQARGLHFDQRPPYVPDNSQRREYLEAEVRRIDEERRKRNWEVFHNKQAWIQTWVHDVELVHGQYHIVNHNYLSECRDLRDMGALLQRHINGEIDQATFAHESKKWGFNRWNWFTTVVVTAQKNQMGN